MNVREEEKKKEDKRKNIREEEKKRRKKKREKMDREIEESLNQLNQLPTHFKRGGERIVERFFSQNRNKTERT